jgi:hypothetical protein
MIIIPKTEEKNFSIREWIAGQSPSSILINGYDHCILGISPTGSVIYSTDDILKTLVGMEHTWNYDDAIEWFEFNILRCFADKQYEPTFVSTSYPYDLGDFTD